MPVGFISTPQTVSHLGSSFFGCEKSIFFKSWLPQCRSLPFWEDHGTEQCARMTILDEHDLYVPFLHFKALFFSEKLRTDYLLIQRRCRYYIGSKKYNKEMTNIVKHLKRWCNSCEDQVVTHPLRCFGTSVMS